MKQQPKKLIYLLALLLTLASGYTFAHPNDISLLKIYIGTDSLDGELLLNGFQVIQLAQQYNLNEEQLSSVSLKNLISNYFNIYFEIKGANGALSKTILDFKNLEEKEFLYSGLYLIFFVRYKPEDLPLTFSSELFIKYSSLQTTKIFFYSKAGQPLNEDSPVILTPKNRSYSLNIYKPDFSAFKPTFYDLDGDGISDRTENLYGLNPELPDSDGDGFSDFIEFFMGWDPFETELLEEQTQAEFQKSLDIFVKRLRQKPTEQSLLLSIAEEMYLQTQDLTLTSPTVQKSMFFSNLDPQAGSEYQFLQDILSKAEIEFYRNFKLSEFLWILVLTISLGFFHALASGAGKGIILAYCLKDDREIKNVLFLSLIFTLTQLVASAIMSLFFLQATESNKNRLELTAYWLQVATGLCLAGIAIFLIFYSVRKIREKIVIGRQTIFDSTLGSLLIGFLAGLASSPFLWALFRLFSEIEAWALIPFIFLAFGLGLFSAVFLTGLVIIVIRYIFLDILPRLILYSELISDFALLIFALLFFFPTVPF